MKTAKPKIQKRQTPNAKKSKAGVTYCRACSSTQLTPYGDLLVKCAPCGLVVAKNIPTFKELSKLYAKDYFFGMEYSDYQADRLALEKNFRQRIRHLKPYLSSEARVAEIGCAYGYFLNLIKDQVAWHKGYDVSPDGIEYAINNLSVNAEASDFLKDKEIKPNSLDLICMWDVVEHLGEPDKHIAKAAQLLKPGGALSLTTGDVSSLNARLRGVNWRMIHPPTHIYYFNVESIKQLLKQHNLEVVSVRHKPTYRNAGSVFNQLICNRKAKQKGTAVLDATYEFAKTLKLDRLNFPLNLYDVMEVTAVKQAA